jgi:hypothetical protein
VTTNAGRTTDTRRDVASLAFSVVVILSVVLLLGRCQSGGVSPGTDEGQRSGGILSVLRPSLVTVPAGATLRLVLDSALSSATSRSGDRVLARLGEDVRVGDKVVVPAGSEVRGRVTAAVPSGRVKTRARLAFEFDTLVLRGKEHPIATGPVDITAGGTHNKDAATIGIGAGAGAIVGAIANGGKGAGLGALIGGAAGTGVVLVNTGKEVALGSGARATVRLTRDVSL